MARRSTATSDPAIRGERAAILAATLLVASAALWNGYPLVFSDTGTYVDSSFGLRVPRDRPLFYGIFLLATHFKLTLWGSLFAQAALVAILVRRVLRACAPACGLAGFLAIVAVLAVATGLPWIAGQLVPDVFSGIGILSLFLLLFHDSGLTTRERSLLAVLLVLSVVVHSSHLLLMLALVSASQVRRWIGRSGSGATVASATGQRRAWLALVVAVASIPAVNFVRTGRVFLSEASDAFVVGRLVEDGIVPRLLEDHCGTESYLLCPYRDRLPATAIEFLWVADGPFERVGGWAAPRGELRRMVVDSLRFYPGMHAQAALSGLRRQLLSFGSADGLRAYSGDMWVTRVLRERFPRESWMYDGSRQQRDELPRAAIARFHAGVTWASVVMSLGCVALAGLGPRRRRPGDSGALHAFVWAALVFNAAIVAAFSSVHDRYQARVVWLVTLAVLVSLADRARPSAGSET